MQLGDELCEEKILILTSDGRVAQQVEDFLYLGADALLTRMVTKTILAEHFPEKREFKHKGRGKKTTNVVTISDRADLGAVEPDAENPELTDPHMPLVKSLQSGSFYIYRLLEEFKPRYVILYDVEMSVVRQLEVFQARHPDFKVLL